MCLKLLLKSIILTLVLVLFPKLGKTIFLILILVELFSNCLDLMVFTPIQFPSKAFMVKVFVDYVVNILELFF